MTVIRIDSSRYAKRLAILVPYRDWRGHLDGFLRHVPSYFRRDKLDRHIDCTIHVVEQADPGPFNKGRLLNAGFNLIRDTADYVCFHDVDYLPMWADYSYVDRPTRLIRYGTRHRENFDLLFGGVVCFRREHFEAVNGFGNDYWGWGGEDTELRMRCDAAGLGRDARDGTFQMVDHEHRGVAPDGRWTAEAVRNWGLLQERGQDVAAVMAADGLSNLDYRRLKSGPATLSDGAPVRRAFHHLLEIGRAPSDGWEEAWTREFLG